MTDLSTVPASNTDSPDDHDATDVNDVGDIATPAVSGRPDTAEGVLARLEQTGWRSLHGRSAPDRRAIDHIAIGPGGIFVIDNHVLDLAGAAGQPAAGGSVSDDTILAANQLADVVRQLLPPLSRQYVVPVLAYVAIVPMSSSRGPVQICTTSMLQRVIESRPAALSTREIDEVSGVLTAGLGGLVPAAARTAPAPAPESKPESNPEPKPESKREPKRAAPKRRRLGWRTGPSDDAAAAPAAGTAPAAPTAWPAVTPPPVWEPPADLGPVTPPAPYVAPEPTAAVRAEYDQLVPTIEPAAEFAPQPTPEPAAEPTPEPAAEPTAELAVEPTAEPAPEYAAEPTAELAVLDEVSADDVVDLVEPTLAAEGIDTAASDTVVNDHETRTAFVGSFPIAWNDTDIDTTADADIDPDAPTISVSIEAEVDPSDEPEHAPAEAHDAIEVEETDAGTADPEIVDETDSETDSEAVAVNEIADETDPEPVAVAEIADETDHEAVAVNEIADETDHEAVAVNETDHEVEDEIVTTAAASPWPTIRLPQTTDSELDLDSHIAADLETDLETAGDADIEAAADTDAGTFLETAPEATFEPAFAPIVEPEPYAHEQYVAEPIVDAVPSLSTELPNEVVDSPTAPTPIGRTQPGGRRRAPAAPWHERLKPRAKPSRSEGGRRAEPVSNETADDVVDTPSTGPVVIEGISTPAARARRATKARPRTLSARTGSADQTTDDPQPQRTKVAKPARARSKAPTKATPARPVDEPPAGLSSRGRQVYAAMNARQAAEAAEAAEAEPTKSGKPIRRLVIGGIAAGVLIFSGTHVTSISTWVADHVPGVGSTDGKNHPKGGDSQPGRSANLQTPDAGGKGDTKGDSGKHAKP